MKNVPQDIAADNKEEQNCRINADAVWQNITVEYLASNLEKQCRMLHIYIYKSIWIIIAIGCKKVEHLIMDVILS